MKTGEVLDFKERNLFASRIESSGDSLTLNRFSSAGIVSFLHALS